jgi:hypothetical protein
METDSLLEQYISSHQWLAEQYLVASDNEKAQIRVLCQESYGFEFYKVIIEFRESMRELLQSIIRRKKIG